MTALGGGGTLIDMTDDKQARREFLRREQSLGPRDPYTPNRALLAVARDTLLNGTENDTDIADALQAVLAAFQQSATRHRDLDGLRLEGAVLSGVCDLKNKLLAARHVSAP